MKSTWLVSFHCSLCSSHHFEFYHSDAPRVAVLGRRDAKRYLAKRYCACRWSIGSQQPHFGPSSKGKQMSAASSSGSSSAYHPPSDEEDSDDADGHSNDGVEDQETAPYRFFPKATYGSIEYPSTVSHPSAILRLISQRDIDDCFNAPNNAQPTLELRYGGLEGTDAPVRGTRVPSQKLLLKLTRRRRRRREDDAGSEGGSVKGKEKAKEDTEEGVFVSEIVGPIAHTVRFRCELPLERQRSGRKLIDGSYGRLPLYPQHSRPNSTASRDPSYRRL